MRTAYNVGVFQILDDGGSQLDGLLFMGRTEIGVVIDDGMHVVCAFQQFQYLVAQYGVQGIIRPYYNDVVLLNLRILYI